MPPVVTLSGADAERDKEDVKATEEEDAANVFSPDAGGSPFSYPAPMPRTRGGHNGPPVQLTAADRVHRANIDPDDYRMLSCYPPSYLDSNIYPRTFPEEPVEVTATKSVWDHDAMEDNEDGEHDRDGHTFGMHDASTLEDITASLRRLTRLTQSGNSDIVRMTDSVSQIMASVSELQKEVQTLLNATADLANAESRAADNESTATAEVGQTHGFDNLHLYGQSGLGQDQAQNLGHHDHCCCSNSQPVVDHMASRQRRHSCDWCGNHGSHGFTNDHSYCHGRSSRHWPASTRRFPRMY